MESRHHLAPPMHPSSSPPTQQNQASTANQKEIDELVKKADDFVSTGKINEALQLYTRAISLNPQNVEEILCKRSQTFLHAELFEEAINDARSVLTLNSDGIELLIALLCLGRAFCELKQFDRGREALRQAVKLCANEEQVQQVQNELKRIDQAESAHAATSRRNSSTNNNNTNQSTAPNPILIADDGEGTDEEDEDEFISEASDSDEEATAAAQHRAPINISTTTSSPQVSSQSRQQSPQLQPSSSPKKRISSLTSTSAIPTPQVTSSSSSSSSSSTCNHQRVKLNLTPGEDVSELECPLCYRVFYNPITLPCGHTFDRSCLARVFDYTDKCPLCREVIHILPEMYPVTVTLNNLVQKYLKKEYEEREAEEKQQTALDANNIPIFVLDYVLFPNCTLPLHIYEPRYRLMIRRCMAGSRCFGLVSCGENGEIARFGTIAKIKSMQLLPDGRSLIETVGTRRFKILSKWEQDGYTCGRVEWLNEEDDNPASTTTSASGSLTTNTAPEANPEEERKALLELCTRGHNIVTTAFKEFGPQVQEAIEQKIGKIPPPNKPLEFSFWLSSILPMSTAMKVDLLKTTSTKTRLERVISIASEIIHHYKSISGGCTIS